MRLLTQNITVKIIKGTSYRINLPEMRNNMTLLKLLRRFIIQSIALLMPFLAYSQDDSFRIEAEDMNFIKGFKIEEYDFASGKKVVAIKDGDEGTITLPFTGKSNKYKIKIGYYDETDGEGQINFLLNDNLLKSFNLNGTTGGTYVYHTNDAETEITADFIDINKGDEIKIEGFKDENELVRIDFIEFEAIDGIHFNPEATLLSPKTGEVYKVGDKIVLNSKVVDNDGDAIDRVEYYANNDLIGVDDEFPFLIEWNNVQKGNYAIYAKSFNENKSTSVTSLAQISVKDNSVDVCNTPYYETDEYLIMEAENGVFTSDEGWQLLTDVAGFVGSSYIQWTGANQFGVPGKGTINYNVKVTNSGIYRLQIRNKINVIDPVNPQAEHNDYWFKALDAQMFVETPNGIAYPVFGHGVPSGANIMEDSRGQGWTKVFSANLTAWGYDTRTKDHKGTPGNVYINFPAAGEYTLQVSGRSVGHGIDRIGLELEGKTGTWGANTSLGETVCSNETLNNYPNVEITTPDFNKSYPSGTNSVEVSAMASDTDGSITKVEFYLNGELSSTDTEAPFTATIGNLQDSIYSVNAKAFDNKGASVSSSTIVFSIGDFSLGNRAPEITIVSPVKEQVFDLGENIFIDSDVIDKDNNLNRIAYFANDKLIANKYNNETTFNWTPTEPGTYHISARAVDDKDLATTANSVLITVVSPNIFPTASITSPLFNTIFAEEETIDIIADVADEDGTVEKVIFYADGNEIGEVNSIPFNFSWTGATSGEYELIIEAFDDAGDSKVSEPVTVIVNNAPTISIDTPEANALYNEDQDITLEVTTSDSDGSVIKVEYYNNDELLATVTEAPFSYTINRVQAGDYSISAKAYDAYETEGNADPVNFSVNALPQISIASPTSNSIIAFGKSIDFTVNTSDQDGTVEKVIYFNGDLQIAEVTTAPFSFSWADAPAGTNNVKAIAFDNNNASNISEEVVLIVNKAPKVSILRPQPEDGFEVGKIITVEASAEDEDGTIEKVEFILDGEKLGEDTTEPYIFNMPGLELGTYELIVKAIDNQGTENSTEPFSIVLSTLPTIKITSPVSGTSFEAGETINFEVETSDQDGEVVKVEYYSNNLLIGTSATSPFNFSWTDATTGMKEITAHVYDNNNGKSVSEKITINIALNVPPTVNITDLSKGTVFQEGSTIEIKVSAVDTDGTISKVEFYANDNLIGETSSLPYILNWNNPMPNSYILKAKAIDDKNAASFTDEIEIKVNAAPEVSISNPSNGEVYVSGSTVNLLAVANDADGEISKVEFLINGNKIGESLASPFTIDWNKPEAGTYELVAIATDTDGGITESEKVNVFIQDANAAVARLVSLTSDTTVAPQAVIPLQAVTEKGFEVTKMEFYVNGVIEMEDTESPFVMNLQVGDEGTYEVKVKAYYQNNGVFESGITTVTVNKALSLEKGINAALNMQVYPNPVTNMAQLRFNMDKPQIVMVSITDIVGNNVVNESTIGASRGENTFQFSLENLPEGIYLLHITAGEKRYVNKVMKQ